MTNFPALEYDLLLANQYSQTVTRSQAAMMKPAYLQKPE